MAAPQDDPQYKLRMTQALKDKLQASARANNRTLNAEINLRLESSYQHLQMTLFGELEPTLRSGVPVVSDRLHRLASSQFLTLATFNEAFEGLNEILQSQTRAIADTSNALTDLSNTEIVTNTLE